VHSPRPGSSNHAATTKTRQPRGQRGPQGQERNSSSASQWPFAGRRSGDPILLQAKDPTSRVSGAASTRWGANLRGQAEGSAVGKNSGSRGGRKATQATAGAGFTGGRLEKSASSGKVIMRTGTRPKPRGQARGDFGESGGGGTSRSMRGGKDDRKPEKTGYKKKRHDRIIKEETGTRSPTNQQYLPGPRGKKFREMEKTPR